MFRCRAGRAVHLVIAGGLAASVAAGCGSGPDRSELDTAVTGADAGGTGGRSGDAGPDARGSGAGAAESGGGSPGACLPALARCDAPGSTCCDGAVCVDRDGEQRCVETCTDRFDCGSLCCLPDSTTGKRLCAPADQCPPIPCSDVGGECNRPGFSCCGGMACVSSNSPEYAGCRKPCTTADDCDTRCCVPYSDGTGGFCAAASACQCAPENGTCGGVARCCGGLTCTAVDSPDAFRCLPTCKTNNDCSTHCCVAVPGTGESACFPGTWCP